MLYNSYSGDSVTNAIQFVNAGGGFTNLFNVFGTLITTSEFTVLDAGIDESEVTGEIEAVTAGQSAVIYSGEEILGGGIIR